jgi:hypothetical protein
MPGSFERDGVRMMYPENWTIEKEDREDGWDVHFQSPATAFLSLSYQRDELHADDLAERALASLREVYKELESSEVQDTLAKSPAVGFDVDFVSLDFTNSAWIRAVPTSAGCLLVLCQCTDAELDLNGRVLAGMRQSIQLDDD